MIYNLILHFKTKVSCVGYKHKVYDDLHIKLFHAVSI